MKMQRVDESSWRSPEGAPVAGGVHLSGLRVWRAGLAGLEAEPELLAADERDRAARLVLPARRRDFVAGRTFLRRTLGALIDRDPAALIFHYGALGKPELEGRELAFNLAHSGDLLVLACAPSGEVGIDVEMIRPDRDFAALARRFFAPDEQAAILARMGQEQSRAFHRIWSRKEAVLKVMGSGVFEGLDTFSVTSDSGAAILRGNAAMAGIELIELDIPGAAATLGFRGPVVTIEAFDHPSFRRQS